MFTAPPGLRPSCTQIQPYQLWLYLQRQFVFRLLPFRHKVRQGGTAEQVTCCAAAYVVASLARQLATYARPHVHPLLPQEVKFGPLRCTALNCWLGRKCAALCNLPALALARCSYTKPRGGSEFLAMMRYTCAQLELLVSLLIFGSAPTAWGGANGWGGSRRGVRTASKCEPGKRLGEN